MKKIHILELQLLKLYRCAFIQLLFRYAGSLVIYQQSVNRQAILRARILVVARQLF